MAHAVHDDPDLRLHAARALADQGAVQEALVAYQELLAAHPACAAAYFELAGILDRTYRRTDLAVELLTCGLRTAGRDEGRFLNSLGVLRLRAQDVDGARTLFQRAIELAPELADPHANLGMIHYERNELEPALEHYGRAVGLAPDSVTVLRNHVLVLSRAGRGSEAIRTGRRVVELAPADPAAWHDLGLALRNAGQVDEGLVALRKSVSLAGHTPSHHSDLLLISLYDRRASTAELFRAHQAWARCHDVRPRFRFQPRTPGSRLRVGYVSADLRSHPVGYFLTPVLRERDRARFEVFAYSSTTHEDAITARIERDCDTFRRVHHLDDDQLAELVHEDRIDVLFDLSGHTAHHRLVAFAQKPAPIQVSWLGYPFTTALPAMDYFVTDRHESPPGHEAWFTEQLLRLPDGYLCVEPPEDAPAVGPLPALTEPAFTFGCFNNLSKLNEHVVELWSRILRDTEPSRLLLHTRELDDPSSRAWVEALFARHGVPAERLVLLGGASHREFLARYGSVDLALDPFPYSGGLTTCEALWMGVPVLTWPGERFCGRHSASHVTNVGLPEFVAHTADDYLRIAGEWRADLPRLATLRAGLRERMRASPLVDAARFTRHFEAELLRIAAARPSSETR